jgi:hypothetical protein
MNAKHWIEDAIRKPGSEKKAAKRAGVSTADYAETHDADSGKAGRRARLAETLMKLRGEK